MPYCYCSMVSLFTLLASEDVDISKMRESERERAHERMKRTEVCALMKFNASRVM